MKVLQCYVLPVLLYGSETWTISKTLEDNIQAAEMWFIRRMLRISYTDRKTNEEVLAMANFERDLLKTIHKRRLNFFGHIMRKGKLENISITGKIAGKRAPGRQRITFLDQLKKVTELTIFEAIHLTSDRQKWIQVQQRILTH